MARVVSPASRLATHRMLCEQTATHSLSRLLKLGDAELDQVYAALDWLGEAQEGIEKLAWVGDRGMLIQARIDTVLRPAGLDWVG